MARSKTGFVREGTPQKPTSPAGEAVDDFGGQGRRPLPDESGLVRDLPDAFHSFRLGWRPRADSSPVRDGRSSLAPDRGERRERRAGAEAGGSPDDPRHRDGLLVIGLETFRDASAVPAVRGDARIALRPDATGVVAHTGRIARWIGRFQKSGNREVTSRFVASLRERYGREVADYLVMSSGIGRAMERGKPLRARQVVEIVGQADALRATIANRNETVATDYFGQKAVGSGRTLLEEGLERESRRLFPANPDIHRLVDAGHVSRLVEDGIRAAGNAGTHVVTTGEAEQIFTTVLNRELQATYDRARRGALNRLSFENPYSISRQAFSAALVGSGRALNINPNRIETDLKDALRSKFEDAVANRLPATALDDEPALRALADEVMESFVAERDAAREAVLGLPIDGAAKRKLLVQALHDDIPADTVPAMGRTYLQVRDDLDGLGKPLEPAELEKPLSRVCNAMTSTLGEPGFQVPGSNRDAMCRSFLRFLLAPGGETQAGAIAVQVEHPESALRAVGQAATWLSREFAQTEEALRTVKGEDGRDHQLFAGSIEVASRYTTMMENLARVVRDEKDAPQEAFSPSEEGHRPLSRTKQSDEAVALLRSVGVAVPALDRVGHENPDAPLSQPTLDRVRESIDGHLRRLEGMRSERPERFENGMVPEARVDYNRGTFRIDGQDFACDQDAVAEGIRAFCTDAGGHLDEEMLFGVSAVTYQAIPNGAIAQLFDLRYPETSLFAGTPGIVSGHSTYELSRNSDGEVTLNVGFASGLDMLARVREDGGDEYVPLDPERSRFNLSVEVKLDAGTFRPTLGAMNVGYALTRGRHLPGESPVQ